jgi:hypothetical protein
MPIARLLVIAIGLSLLVPFAYCVGQKIMLWSVASTATATVIALKRGVSSNSHYPSEPLLFPVVRFVTAEGQSLTVTSPSASIPQPYHVGQQVRVRYHPDHPQQVELTDFFSQWGAILITALFALLGGAALRAVFSRKTSSG